MPLLKWFRRQDDQGGNQDGKASKETPISSPSESLVRSRPTDRLANLFNLLRSPGRLSILYALLQGDQSFGRLERETSTRSYSTTINLRALMAAGLVEKLPGKRTAPYRITPRGVQVVKIVDNLIPLAEAIEPIKLESSNGRRSTK